MIEPTQQQTEQGEKSPGQIAYEAGQEFIYPGWLEFHRGQWADKVAYVQKKFEFIAEAVRRPLLEQLAARDAEIERLKAENERLRMESGFIRSDYQDRPGIADCGFCG